VRQTRQIGALGQVAAHQAVGVLVGGTLPGAVGITEEDRHVQGAGELQVPGHLGAAVVSQRLAKRRRDLAEAALEGLDDAARGAVVGQTHEQELAAGALDQGADGGLAASALDEVALPVAGLQAVEHMRRAHADGGDVLDAREAAAAPAVQTAPGVAALPKVRDEFGLQRGSGQVVDGPIDGLVTDIQRLRRATARIKGPQPPGDDLGRVIAAPAPA
jgi:hypothetical protein